jgi:UDP-3-O-acyl-N-acetylglucosamine deacetylase
VFAYRAGHDMHGRLARRILESTDSWFLAPWSDEGPVPDALGARSVAD